MMSRSDMWKNSTSTKNIIYEKAGYDCIFIDPKKEYETFFIKLKQEKLSSTFNPFEYKIK